MEINSNKVVRVIVILSKCIIVNLVIEQSKRILRKKEYITMKKTWENATVEELVIGATASGATQSENHDGDWVSIDGTWYRPGGDVIGS